MKSRSVPLVLLAAFCGVSCASHPRGSDPAFREELRERALADREDPTHWDLERMRKDIESGAKSPIPFTFGAFPVADYDRLGEGSYAGGGYVVLPGIQGYHGTIEDE